MSYVYKSISKTVYKVNDFLSWQRSGSLRLSPSFQRRSVWSDASKSFLIDTVVRGLPIPIIFIREQTDLTSLEPIREVVDGQQRLRTLISFIEPEALKDYDEDRDFFQVRKSHNAELTGKLFRELEPTVQKQILNYDFSVHVLPSDTDDREILQIFARMNSTGVKLNKQELRNAAYFGDFKSLMYTLAYEQLTRWRNWRIFSENDIARMIEVEETSDIVRVMLNGVVSKSQPGLDKTYEEYDDEFPLGDIVADRYRTVMDKIDEQLGSRITSTVYNRKALFHSLFTLYYDLLYGLKSNLVQARPKKLPSNLAQALLESSDRIQKGKVSEELLKVLRGATGNVGSRRERLNFLRSNIGND